jgi:predicted ABC-type transport system involved in lysophospholipase L1 biosynthesis ATPase subunit
MDELLSLRDVRLHYVRGARHLVRVLEGVSLRVGAGEVVCVWAQRGQGKTTLLRVAAGLERPGSGRVLFEGRDVWGMAEGERAELLSGGIGWVERVAPEAVGVSMLRFVAMPALRAGGRRGAYARAEWALERVGAAGCAGQVWGSLDEAERVRIALARGIVHEPRLLVVDDLAAMLSVRGADEVVELLASLARERGVGVLVSVSDLSATTWSDRVATLYGGELMVPAGSRRGGGGKVVELPVRPPLASG